jgi:D-serine deaminase-like pyridoxal phosphate-dependent protein
MTYPPKHGLEQSNAWIEQALAVLKQAGIAVARVTAGNSPDMWAPGGGPVTERRPGTYIYYDRMQVGDKVASFDDCALTVLATVVSRPTPTRAVIDAGSKSLAYDLVASDMQLGYGLVMGTDLIVKGLSEEHGVIEMPVASDWPRVGDRLRIIPNHVCVISNLFDTVTLISGDEVKETVPVAARGRVD